VIRKARFWETHAETPLNGRQRLILNKMLDDSAGKLTDCSQDTAHRDILDLVQHGIVIKDPAGGRSTGYSLKEA